MKFALKNDDSGNLNRDRWMMMDPKPATSVREVFLGAAEIDDPHARAAYLDQCCAGDQPLRRRVEALLAAEAEAGPSPELAKPVPAAPAALTDPALGSRIGHYKLLQQIGEGGCGVVFMAEQEEPVRRKVALKVIKLGMDTRQVVARFEAERQALAMMDHPNIAQVFDAGATESGRPYFVMELVRGTKITDYCDEHQLSTPQRLDLFIQVCHAVQHAHQKGIIHRDLKPSNLLITELDGAPLPKIIDFGIAKAVEGRLTDQTLFTAFEQFIGTPAYMSPEQATLTATDIDTRSDVYSLGVLLYELLTGQTPFDTRALLASGLDQMRQTIREVQPMRPSTRVRQTSSVASRSGSPLRSRPPLLAADLDWIVMKCLEKDRRRRYETANGLALDVQRHLDNQPVLARPPSRLYEFQKSVRRHKFGFAATAAMILVLLFGVLVSFWQANRATSAEEQAVTAKAAETKLRQKAQVQELAARRRAYAADMVQAKQLLDRDNLGTARSLLEQQKPETQQQDLRGWEWRYLWNQTRSDALFTLGQVRGEINSLAASADTNWLAVGLRHRGGLSVWDLRKREESIRLTESEERTRTAFSPAGPLLAFAGSSLLDSGQQKSTLHLWNVRTKEMVDEAPLAGACAGLAFCEDGRMLVTSTEAGPGGGYITLWEVRGGTELARSRSYPCQQSIFPATTCFAATPDLRLAAFTYGPAGQRCERVRVVDLHTGDELWSFAAAQEVVTALALSPDGKILATARGIGEKPPVINLWDVGGKKEIGTPLLGHRQPPLSMVFWPDGTRLASASGDKTIRIWNTATGECVDVLRGQDDSLRRLALLPDGQTLVSGDSGGKICFWDTSVTHPRQPHIEIPATVLAWCFTPDSHSVLTLDVRGEIAQWTGVNFQHQTPLMEIGGSLFRDHQVHQFSQDGRLLALGSTHGVLQVWDLSGQRLRYQWTNTTGLAAPLEFRAHDNTLLTWSESNHELQKWDLATGQRIECLPVPPWARAQGFSPDGQVAIECDEMGNVWRLNLADRSKLKKTPPIFEGSDVAFSPDGRLLAISSITGSVLVWDTTTWSVQATNLYGVHSVVFSPDGTRLATGGGNALAVNLWDTTSWKLSLRLPGEKDGFAHMAFSPDGNRIGSLNMAGTLYLWSAPSWEEIAAAERGSGEPAHPLQPRAR